MINAGKRKKVIKDNFDYWVFLLVPIIAYTIFFLIPNIKSIYMSFFEWDGMSAAKVFVGFRNFMVLFTKDTSFLLALRNTLLYTAVVLVFQTAFSLAAAVLISSSKKKINSVYRTFIYLPYILSSVAIGFIWTFIYDPNLGVLNNLFKALGLNSWCRIWLSNGTQAIISVAMVHIWYGIGQGMLLFIAGLQQIPAELYEAAEVDGANGLRKFIHITLPQLKGVSLTVITLTVIGCFKSFDFVYVLTGGGADGSSSVLALQIYKEAFQFSRVGYSAAISVVLLVCIGLIYGVQYKILSEKGD